MSCPASSLWQVVLACEYSRPFDGERLTWAYCDPPILAGLKEAFQNKLHGNADRNNFFDLLAFLSFKTLQKIKFNSIKGVGLIHVLYNTDVILN